EVAEALHLRPDEVTVLGRLLRLNEPRFAGGGNFGVDQWEARIPSTIEDTPSDTLAYIQQTVGADYDPNVPIEAVKRLSYLLAKGNKETIEASPDSSARRQGTQATSVSTARRAAASEPRIFISYSRADALFIDQLVPLLEEVFPDYETWY